MWAGSVIIGALLIAAFLIMLNIPFYARRDEKIEKIAEATVSNVVVKTATPHDSGQVASRKDETEDGCDEEESLPEPAVVNGRRSFFGGRKTKTAPFVREFALYAAPPIDLLDDTKGIPSSGDIKANANIIKRTLANFGIDVEMAEVHIGPSITQYTLKPAEGIKLSRITALHNDIALALAAHPLRIEAPIPGKSLVGIEVPNRSIALVGLRSIIDTEEFKQSSSLVFAIGRDVTGSPVFADIARMPHLLIAGSTGSGKSITIHSLIISLLYKNAPQVLRFIMIDPKRVELSMYNEIPHLLAPVITDAKKTILSLRWAVREMERRYEVLSQHKSRDIFVYNADQTRLGHHEQVLPFLIIIIDELADLMGAYPREIEASIVRLAQMSRAVGIHLIVSTQRPSVEVITGLIKANITARIALVVASNVDSRTILDMSGAEKLLGNGDMLYLAGDTSKPRRVQGAFISDKEVKRAANYLAEHIEEAESIAFGLDTADVLGESVGKQFADENDDVDDELYEDARSIIIEAQKASTSYLQRRLRIGYARAARLIDMLEERGVVGPGEGAKARDVLIKKSGDGGYNNDDYKEEQSTAEFRSNEPDNSSDSDFDDDDVPYTKF